MAIPSSSPLAPNADLNSSSNKRARSRAHSGSSVRELLTRTKSLLKLSDTRASSESGTLLSRQNSCSSLSFNNTNASTTEQQKPTSRRVWLSHCPGSLRDLNTSEHGTDSSSSTREQSKRKMFRRNSTGKKRVRFAPEEQLAVVSAVLPKQSEREIRRMFYTEEEISMQAAECKQLAEEVAWKKDDSCNVLTCLHYLYGWKSASPSSVQRRRSNNATTSAAVTSSNGLTKEHALTFLYTYKVTEEDGTLTAIRGLERQMSLKISDQRSVSIQAVLGMQRKLKDTSISSSSNHKSKESPEEKLAQVAMAASTGAQRFARILGKADRAVVKGYDGSSTKRGTNSGCAQ